MSSLTTSIKNCLVGSNKKKRKHVAGGGGGGELKHLAKITLSKEDWICFLYV